MSNAEQLMDQAFMQIQIDMYGAYDLVPESDRAEFERKYGAWCKFEGDACYG